MDRLDTAMERLDEAVERARGLVEIGRHEQARDVLSGVLATQPDHFAALCLISRVYIHLGEPARAVAAAEAAAAVEADRVSPHLLRSAALLGYAGGEQPSEPLVRPFGWNRTTRGHTPSGPTPSPRASDDLQPGRQRLAPSSWTPTTPSPVRHWATLSRGWAGAAPRAASTQKLWSWTRSQRRRVPDWPLWPSIPEGWPKVPVTRSPCSR
jgi:hypothetical protein